MGPAIGQSRKRQLFHNSTVDTIPMSIFNSYNWQCRGTGKTNCDRMHFVTQNEWKDMILKHLQVFLSVLECSWVKNISVPFPSAWSGKRKSFHFSRHNFNKPSKFLDLQCSTIVNYGVRNWALVRVELECKENEKDKFVFNYRSTFGEAKLAGVYNICARLVFDRRQLENRKGFKLLVLSLTKNFKLCV